MTGVLQRPAAAYLQQRLDLLEVRARQVLTARLAADPEALDPARGLVVTPEQVLRLLDAAAASDGSVEVVDLEAIVDLEVAAPLPDLAHRVGLDAVDSLLLVVAAAPHVDRRFEVLYGFLNDDVTRRCPTVGVALELAGCAVDAMSYGRLQRFAPLRRWGLVEVADDDRPWLGRELRVPDRLVGHLIGAADPEPALQPLAAAVAPSEFGRRLGQAMAGERLCYLREAAGADALTCAAAMGRAVTLLDLRRLGSQRGDPVAAARLHAALTGDVLLAGPVDELARREPRLLGELASLPGGVVLYGRTSWDPRWSDRVPLTLDAPPLSGAERSGAWQALGVAAGDADVLAETFRLSARGVPRSLAAAREQADFAGEQVGRDHLVRGARTENAAGLEQLALRVTATAGWDDLVLPGPVVAALRGLGARARHRDRVLGEWGMGGSGARGRGVTALFAGPSGTGKTLAGEVIAHDLGLDLYAVNLSRVVDKYVGETEKNLERIFSEAEDVSAVLLFDEADALFGRRSEVSDAHDRHANVEVAYLLQRMERFDGLAILATNMRANLDEAFARRLDAIVEFPLPGVSERERIWDISLGRSAPRSESLDLGAFARDFELAGGSIRAACLTAAYAAADRGCAIDDTLLREAVAAEHRKLGRLPH